MLLKYMMELYIYFTYIYEIVVDNKMTKGRPDVPGTGI